jgi:hypothetical protein
MGNGEFGSNGSVHYSIRDDDSPAAPPKYTERDPIPYDQIGRGTGGGKGHPGFLAVRMRFPDAAAARSALTAAIATIGSVTGGNGIYATCMVPVVTPVRPNADADPFNEVKVDW